MGEKSDDLTKLGLTASATASDIKKAYRAKALELHPDKNLNNKEAAQAFQDMKTAYDRLANPETKYEPENTSFSVPTAKETPPVSTSSKNNRPNWIKTPLNNSFMDEAKFFDDLKKSIELEKINGVFKDCQKADIRRLPFSESQVQTESTKQNMRALVLASDSASQLTSFDSNKRFQYEFNYVDAHGNAGKAILDNTKDEAQIIPGEGMASLESGVKLAVVAGWTGVDVYDDTPVEKQKEIAALCKENGLLFGTIPKPTPFSGATKDKDEEKKFGIAQSDGISKDANAMPFAIEAAPQTSALAP